MGGVLSGWGGGGEEREEEGWEGEGGGGGGKVSTRMRCFWSHTSELLDGTMSKTP